MSEIIDISVGLTEERVEISVSEVGSFEINATPTVIEVNIITGSTINPLMYDLSDFTNNSANPFVQYSALAGFVPISRLITINGVTQDLSTDRSWTVSASAVWGGITGSLSAQTDLQAALNAKEPTITAGTISQYWRGDKTWQTFPTIPTVTPSALTKTDDTNVTLTLGGSPSTALLQGVSLTLGWTGTLADSRIASAATWNAKQDAITLTTTGSSGSATLIGATLNVPTYTLLGLGGVAASRNITINGITQDLSADRSWSVGTVTSVGLSMPSAFAVASSPVTGAGTIAVTGAGVASQYIRGDGSLANFPTSTGGGASVSYYLNGSVSQGTLGGVAYKEINSVPVIGAGTDFNINADGYIAQFITDVGDPNKLLIPAGNWNFETYFSASSGGGSPRFYIELYKYNGTTFTLIASNSATPENITGGTSIDLYFTALAVPATTLLATDRLAVRFYVIHSGRTITMHTENSHLSQIITTFSTGLTALNGLSSQVQYLAVGTTGTDFNISSATDTHTFNLPTASATNRGALSSADWGVFNGKQNAITLTTTGTSGPATLVGATLNIPQYGGGGGGGTIYKLTAQTLAVGSWTLSGSYYIYTFSNVNITVNTRVDFTPDNASYSEVTTCGMLPEVDVAAGSCTFYSLFPPQNNILGEITIFPTV
jgi:hypothetical protein